MMTGQYFTNDVVSKMLDVSLERQCGGPMSTIDPGVFQAMLTSKLCLASNITLQCRFVISERKKKLL